MKRLSQLAAAIVLLLAYTSQTIRAQGTAFTYQGRLNNNSTVANGSYDFQFILFNVDQYGFPVGPVLTNAAVTVSNGLFTTTLDFGTGVYTGTNLWLDISVRPNGNGTFSELLPRQPLTPTPYAVFANSASNLLGAVSTVQLGVNPVFNGTVTATSFSDPNGLFIGGDSSTIEAGGNNSTIGGGNANYIGTTCYETTISGGYNNYFQGNDEGGFIGGGGFNQIGSGNYDSVIVGGSENVLGTNGDGVSIGGGVVNTIGDNGNAVSISGGRNNSIGTNDYGASIGGGVENKIGSSVSGYGSTATIGGGNGNSIGNSADGDFIGGGANNQIGDGTAGYQCFSVIVGGNGNVIGTNVENGFIGGGQNNQIINSHVGYLNSSVIGGGANNIVQSNAFGATIPGGYDNIAGASYSFAAGSAAQATNNGAFVWCDGTVNTASIANNSVTFRASGGYRFFTGTGVGGAMLAANATSWTTLSDRNAKKNFEPVDTVAVLDKLAAIPIQQWNYKWEKDNDVPNIGPMAQDFKHAFYPGRDDKGISTLEFDGVELAAIQGLNQKLTDESKAKDAEIEALKAKAAQVDSLEARLNELETTVQSLAAKK